MADEINGFEGLYWNGTIPFIDESKSTDGTESANIENSVNVVVNQAGIDVDGDLKGSTDQSDNQPGIIDKVADIFKGGLDSGDSIYPVVDPFGLPTDPAPHEDTWADPDELTEQQKTDGLTIGIDPLGGTWIVNSNDDPVPEEIDRFNRKLEYIDGYAKALGKTFVYDPNASFAENMHKALELGGFAPGVGAAADIANAVLYLSEGNYKEAGYGAIAAVPLGGDAFAAGRITNKAGKVAEGIGAVAKEVSNVGGKTYNVNGKILTESDFSVLRQKAVNQAWKEEKELAQTTGRGSREWTEAEKQELLSTGRVKGYEGQHMKSAEAYPDHVGNPNNIQFLKGRGSSVNEHLDAHGGNYKNPTNGYYDPQTGKFIEFLDYIPGP